MPLATRAANRYLRAMKPADYARSALWALAILVVNVLISVVVMVVYSYAVEPGHDAAFYEAAAPRIAPWSSVVFGIPLFFGVARYGARRSPARNASAFALAIFGFYASIDITVLQFAGSTLAEAGIVALSMGTKLAAALAGARISTTAR